MHVLLCDDSAEDADLVARELRRALPAVDILRIDSMAALEAALVRPDVDLLLTDYELAWTEPTDGLTLLRRAREIRPLLPILMVTGSGNEEVAAAAMREGAFDYVTKSRLRRVGPAAKAALEHAEALRARAASEAELRRALDEKQVLLEELYHRVNNNLQLVIAFLDAESVQSDDPRWRDRLDVVAHRVEATALVQEQLYRSRDYKEIDVAAYLERLVGALTAGTAVKAETALIPVYLPVGRAVAVGLIANELLANALKHAPSPSGALFLYVRLARMAGEVVLTVVDSGPGFVPAARVGGTGLHLLRTLERQLDGTLTFSTGSAGGTTAAIRFPLKERESDAA